MQALPVSLDELRRSDEGQPSHTGERYEFDVADPSAEDPEGSALLRDMITRLPEVHRNVVALKAVGFGENEIARRLNITQVLVADLLQDAHAALLDSGKTTIR